MPFVARPLKELVELNWLLMIRMILKHVVCDASDADFYSFKKTEAFIADQYSIIKEAYESPKKRVIDIVEPEKIFKRFDELANSFFFKQTEARKQFQKFINNLLFILQVVKKSDEEKADIITGLKLLQLYEIAIPGYGNDFCAIISNLDSKIYTNSVTFKNLMINVGLIERGVYNTEVIVPIDVAEIRAFIAKASEFLKDVKDENTTDLTSGPTLDSAIEKISEMDKYLEARLKQEIAPVAEQVKNEPTAAPSAGWSLNLFRLWSGTQISSPAVKNGAEKAALPEAKIGSGMVGN